MAPTTTTTGPTTTGPTTTGPTTTGGGEPDVAVVVRDGGGWSPSAVTLVIWTSGRVVRTAPATMWGYEELSVAPSVVRDLLATAAAHRLLEPRDAGDPGITDQSTLAVSIDDGAGTGVHTTAVYAPAERAGLSADALQTRADVDAFTAALVPLRAASAPLFTRSPQPLVPDALRVVAEPMVPDEAGYEVDTADESPWPLSRPLAAVFDNSECVELSGNDATALRTAVGADHTLVVPTEDAVVVQARLRVSAVVPGSSPCYADNRTVGIATTPWPADHRDKATVLDRWAAQVVLRRLAFADGLGREAHSSADLTWYDYTYAVVMVGADRFVDVAAHYNFSERDPAGFMVRFNRATGEVTEKAVG